MAHSPVFGYVCRNGATTLSDWSVAEVWIAMTAQVVAHDQGYLVHLPGTTEDPLQLSTLVEPIESARAVPWAHALLPVEENDAPRPAREPLPLRRPGALTGGGPALLQDEDLERLLLGISLEIEPGRGPALRLHAVGARLPLLEWPGLTDSDGPAPWQEMADRRWMGWVDAATLVRALRQAVERRPVIDLHDALTGLPGRTLLMDRLAQALAQSQELNQLGALLLVNLDGFSAINASYGRQSGDLLLAALGQRLSRCVRGSDTVARLEDDTFAILLSAVGSGENAGAVARKVLAEAGKRFSLDGLAVTTTVSIGISIYPHDGGDLDAVTAAAHQALRHAKLQGGNGYQLHRHLGVF